MTIGCIDEFETEKTSTPTTIPTLETVVPETTVIDEDFIDKYIEAKEIYKYDCYERELKAEESKSSANEYYERDQLNEASDKYCEAAQFYLKAREQNLAAKALFEEAHKIAPTESYKELCALYISAAQSDVDSMIHISSAMEHMEKACDYYEKGSYEAGDDEVEEQGKEIIRYNIKIETRNTAIEKIDEIEGW